MNYTRDGLPDGDGGDVGDIDLASARIVESTGSSNSRGPIASAPSELVDASRIDAGLVRANNL